MIDQMETFYQLPGFPQNNVPF